MSTTDERVLKSLRAQAWERAKGELQAMLVTYWDGREGKFNRTNNTVQAFIKEVEDNGLVE